MPSVSSQKKKKGCSKGCLTIAVVGFIGIFLIGFVGDWLSENKWEKERSVLLDSIEQAVDEEDYNKALSLADLHRSRNDPKLNSLIAKAESLKRDAAKRARDEQIAKLIVEIDEAQGDEREKKLEKLLSLSPRTKEFPGEISIIREKRKQREEEARAKREADRKAEIKLKKEAREKQARLELEKKLAEFKWRYAVTEDELTSKPSYQAAVTSINQVSFDFPYQGAQRGELMLRTHPQHGKDLILRVQKGQMLVQSYQDSTVKVVFDGGSPVSYKVVGPADHSTTSLFLRDYSGFVGRMLKAKRIKISVPFYQEGNVVFEFNISDFDTKKYLGKN